MEAPRLWDLVDRPNLMIKIPATKEGLPAIEHSIVNGLNINVTLIFSLDRYEEVMEAYISGLEKRIVGGTPIDNIASVASFFVSRIDSKIDLWLNESIAQGQSNSDIAENLLGKIAVASAKMAYQRNKKIFNSERFIKLRTKGARLQRPLWASTSTKNPSYSDVLYIDSLIGPLTVNTIPPNTLLAFNRHGIVSDSLEKDLDLSELHIADLKTIGISLNQATDELEQEGVVAFKEAFSSLIETIESRRREVVGL